jgi:hypothetical protein
VQSTAAERLQSKAAKSVQSANAGFEHTDESRWNDNQGR